MSATATRPRKRSTSRNGATPDEKFGGSIVIPSGCKPSKAVSADYTRPILTNAYLRRHKGETWLCATDSYIAVAIKVDGDAREGFIPVGALRLMEAGQAAEQIDRYAWKVQTKDGAVTFDISERLAGAIEYPSFEGLGVWDDPAEADLAQLAQKGQPVAVGLNHNYMKRIGDALGARSGCRYELSTPLKPVRVVPLGEFDRVALQMPIRLNV